jgi:hypothetical protein
MARICRVYGLGPPSEQSIEGLIPGVIPSETLSLVMGLVEVMKRQPVGFAGLPPLDPERVSRVRQALVRCLVYLVILHNVPFCTDAMQVMSFAELASLIAKHTPTVAKETVGIVGIVDWTPYYHWNITKNGLAQYNTPLPHPTANGGALVILPLVSMSCKPEPGAKEGE